jgi:hypothetical protein
MALKPDKLVAVALANKTARIIWALLAKRGSYRKREAPRRRPDQPGDLGVDCRERAQVQTER